VAGVALPVLLSMAALVAGLSLTVVGAAVRLHRQPALIAWSPVDGMFGTTSTPLEPEGVVRVSGQLWSARLIGGTLGPGEPVLVRGRTGLTLEVEPAGPGGTPGEEEFPYAQ
jgi:membrane-bound ClpP family serine protease